MTVMPLDRARSRNADIGSSEATQDGLAGQLDMLMSINKNAVVDGFTSIATGSGKAGS
jgi:hypothetical protein